MSYDVCHMHLFHQLNIYHDHVLQSTYSWKYVCWQKTHRATLGQSHINSFWNSPLCFKIWYLLQWVTLYFSSNTDPRLTCVRVLMLRFSLIHQRSVSENVLWSLFFPFTHCFYCEETGHCIFWSKGAENFRIAWTWFHHQIQTIIFPWCFLLFQHLQVK